jgi:hypothetical protein
VTQAERRRNEGATERLNLRPNQGAKLALLFELLDGCASAGRLSWRRHRDVSHL